MSQKQTKQTKAKSKKQNKTFYWNMALDGSTNQILNHPSAFKTVVSWGTWLFFFFFYIRAISFFTEWILRITGTLGFCQAEVCSFCFLSQRGFHCSPGCPGTPYSLASVFWGLKTPPLSPPPPLADFLKNTYFEGRCRFLLFCYFIFVFAFWDTISFYSLGWPVITP